MKITTDIIIIILFGIAIMLVIYVIYRDITAEKRNDYNYYRRSQKFEKRPYLSFWGYLQAKKRYSR